MKKIHYILSVLLFASLFVSCNQDMAIESEQGYLALNINSLVSTHTPNASRAAAPENYSPKILHVEIQNAKGEVVKSTDNFAGDIDFQGNISLRKGTYTIIAHSANWDGEASGFDVPFYYGETTITIKPQTLVTATLTCTLANVKITVNYDAAFARTFKSAVATITSSLTEVLPLEFAMNQETRSGYIPVGDFNVKLDVVNKNDKANSLTKSFTNVKARDHYILNFKLTDEGYLGNGAGGGVKVEVDESTNTYTFTFEVPKKSAITLLTRDANPWSNFAILNGQVTAKTPAFKETCLIFRWKAENAEEWNDISFEALTIDAEDNVTAILKGLTPNTTYEYHLCYVDADTEVVSDPATFTTESQTPLYNGGFEHWYKSGSAWYATESGVSYWDSSNPGSTSLGDSYNVTTRTESSKVSGSYAAKLESKYIVIKFAAASLYTGKFKELVGTKGAKLDWGVSFTSRPTALKGWMQYAPVKIDNGGSNLPAGAPAKGEMDQCGMFVALLTQSISIDNTDLSSIPDLETDSRVVAYGSLPQEQNVSSNGQWKEVNIPLVYRTLTKKPSHLLIVFSSSKYGDYFHGGTGSTLYLDDFSFEYGDSPIVK